MARIRLSLAFGTRNEREVPLDKAGKIVNKILKEVKDKLPFDFNPNPELSELELVEKPIQFVDANDSRNPPNNNGAEVSTEKILQLVTEYLAEAMLPNIYHRRSHPTNPLENELNIIITNYELLRTVLEKVVATHQALKAALNPEVVGEEIVKMMKSDCKHLIKRIWQYNLSLLEFLILNIRVLAGGQVELIHISQPGSQIIGILIKKSVENKPEILKIQFQTNNKVEIVIGNFVIVLEPPL